jgi:glutamate formiminotransferase/formiminotetrahydrofolate cyclodeaminase
MSAKIVECIANYSEARRPEVVETIAAAIRSVSGVYLLDRHSDLDHNRTVLTFAGSPEGVEEAAFRSIAIAAQHINLDEHTGEHPRIGATDVVPFVPISGATMQECIEIAERLGHRVGSELGIPVYLYEQAAHRPERVNLEDIRRGQYEGLKEEILTNPQRQPDFGPARLGAAGATVIGARHPLIAFNVYLTTDDVSIARKIAKAIRHSSGGLRYLKALGLLVEGRAQVSMNLTNYQATPIARVVEAIRREAERYGTGIHHSELVGLIPEAALVDAAVWYTQLDQFEPEQVLERRLRAALEAGSGGTAPAPQPGKDLLEALSADTPTPGGGSAAAYSGAMGAALVIMVARLTIGKKKYAGAQDAMQGILLKAEQLQAELLEDVSKDAAAFEAVMAAYRLPKDTLEEQSQRQDAIQAATLAAAQAPLQVARKAVQVLSLAEQAVALGNVNAISDGAVGAALASAALTGAGYNVRINLPGLHDRQAAAALLAELAELERQAAGIEAKVQQQLRSRADLAQE